jgi:hypothetical protein
MSAGKTGDEQLCPRAGSKFPQSPAQPIHDLSQLKHNKRPLPKISFPLSPARPRSDDLRSKPDLHILQDHQGEVLEHESLQFSAGT